MLLLNNSSLSIQLIKWMQGALLEECYNIVEIMPIFSIAKHFFS